jgi:hypothetical protein
MNKVIQIKEKLREHDFYYDFADDHYSWSRGFKQKRDILDLAKEIPVKAIPSLVDIIPDQFKNQWIQDFINVMKDKV